MARADSSFYGTVESFAGNEIVVRTTQNSIGRWKIDSKTRREGSFSVGDWVFAEVGAADRLKTLRFEERPIARTGTIQKISDRTLTVRTELIVETWNLKETTLTDGVSASDLKAGDEIAAKLYRNHNLATIRLLKRGASR